jgi:hypothetical protein
MPIVDDISGNPQMIESLLAPEDHAIRTACDGAEGQDSVIGGFKDASIVRLRGEQRLH